MPRIPLIEELTNAPVPPGSNLLVEFDAASQWYNASINIGAGWIRSGGLLAYNAVAQPPERVRARFKDIRLDPGPVEQARELRIFDWYTATLGRKSKETLAQNSLRIADLSIQFSQQEIPGPPIPDILGITDSASILTRFNDEKIWVEFALTRAIPSSYTRQSTSIDGLLNGVHSVWAYRQLESAYDGIIDFKLEEDGKRTRDLVRIRSMRDLTHDRHWHELKISEKLEISLLD